MPGLNKNNPFNREVKLIFTISQGEIKWTKIMIYY
jgi:hypothetical protein